MQEIESTKIDLQQIKQESKDSLTNQLNQTQLSTINSQTTSTNCTRKTDQNIFQASLERQRNLLLNMEQHQLAIYPTTQLLNESDSKVMDIQVDSNNNNMPVLISYNRQTGSLPSINELRNNQRLNLDQLLINNQDKKLNTRLSQQTNSQFNQTSFTGDDNDFNRFDVICKMEDDDYSRLSHTQTSLYDNYESIKMEDAFQDDKLDFKTGPTLAELNLNDDDMMDNLPTVNPNSILCPSIPMPQTNKHGFLMGCNYTNNNLSTINNSTISTQTDSHINLLNKDLVLSNDQFSLNNQFDQLNSHNHLNSNDLISIKNSKSLSTNSNKSTSYNTRTRGRQKSNSDKQSKRTNQQQQQNLSQNNQVLCKLLNEKNDNLNNFPLITTNESINQTINSIASGQSQIPSTSSTNLLNNNTQFQSICITTSLNLSNSNKSILTQSNTSLANLQNDILLNQLKQQAKCSLSSIITNNNLRINNSQAARNRNSSISTEHSFSSSHDEGFISQAEDDSDEKDEDAQMIIDHKLISKAIKTTNKAKRKRPRKDQDKETNSLNSTEQITNNINMKKIKIENDQFKPPISTSSGFAFTLSTVKEESVMPNALLSAITAASTTPITKTTNLINSPITKTANKNKEDKINTKGRVNYKITKDKPILTDFQQQQIKIENCNNKLIDEKVNDEESSDDEDDESFYGDFEDKDLIGATTSDDQQNKWSLNMGRSRKNSAQRYFWQYNVQSKGPKGTKLTTTISENNLEGELNTTGGSLGSDLEPLDPVFSPNCHIEGVKHAGKARRGDGNDLTANPKKLLMIGLELKKLSKIINDLTPVAEVPQNSKSNSRKEKNKLASRACRLKKKAQHEANKIKLHGLSHEFKKLMTLMNELKKFQDKVIDGKVDTRKIKDQINNLIEEKGSPMRVAGNTTEFVNSVLDSVSLGNINGNLDRL